MKSQQIIKDYLTFNKTEQRGLFVLIIVFLLVIIANAMVPYFVSRQPDDFAGFAKEISAFEKEIALCDSLDEKTKLKKYPAGSGFPYGNFDSVKGYKKRPDEVFYIELNSADTFDLQRLKGIGSSFAKRIVNYRVRLGGYLDKSQVLEVFGMDSARYGRIKDFLIVNKDSIRKIDLNSVTFKELLYHPYFPFAVTKEIMIYRKEHKKFLTLEELKKIPVMNDSIYRKVIPYLHIR